MVQESLGRSLNELLDEVGLPALKWVVTLEADCLFVETSVSCCSERRGHWVEALGLAEYEYQDGPGTVWFAAGDGWLMEVTITITPNQPSIRVLRKD